MDYLGEVIVLSGNAELGPLSLTPGKINFSYKSKIGAEILLNTNYLDGWIETKGEARAFNHNSLLALRLPVGEKKISLQYSPSYFYLTLISSLIGFFGLLLLRRKSYEL